MKKPIDVLKTYFETGDVPTEQQFADLIDSFIHKDDGFVITGTEQTPTGLIISFSDGSTETLPIFVLQNQEIAFINGLQEFINSVTQFQNGLTLTENNFSNQNLQDLTNLVQFFDQFQSYSGELSVIEINFQGISNGGATYGDILNGFAPEVVIEKGQLLKMNLFEADFGDGNHALKKVQVVFALPSGVYGAGTPNQGTENLDAFVVCSVVQSDSRSVTLNRPFLSFGISRNADDYDISNQEHFNSEVFDYANAINTASRSVRYLNLTNSAEIAFVKDLGYNFRDEIVETDISFRNILAGTGKDAEGFSSLLVVTSTIQEDPLIYNKIEVGYFEEFDQIFCAIKLTEFNNNTENIRYIKSNKFAAIEDRELNITSQVEFVSRFYTDGIFGTLNGFFVINNFTINLDDELNEVTIIDVIKTNASPNDLTNRIGFISDFAPEQFELNYFGVKLNDDLKKGFHFWLNEKEDVNAPHIYSSDYSIRAFKRTAELKERLNSRFYFKDALNKFKGTNGSLRVDDLVNLVKNKFPRVYKCLITQPTEGTLEATFEKNELGEPVKFSHDLPANQIVISLKDAFPEEKTNIMVGSYGDGSACVPVQATWINEGEIRLSSPAADFLSSNLKIWLKIEIEPEI